MNETGTTKKFLLNKMFHRQYTIPKKKTSNSANAIKSMKMTKIRTSGNGNPSNFHVICGVGFPVALPTHENFAQAISPKVIMK